MKRPLLFSGLLGTVVALGLGAIWGCASFRPDIGEPDPATFSIRLWSGGEMLCIDEPAWTPEEVALLGEWVGQLGQGGRVSFNTFAPGLVVSGEGFSANFLSDGHLVLNARSAGGGKWTQVVRRQTAVDAAVLALVQGKLAGGAGAGE